MTSGAHTTAPTAESPSVHDSGRLARNVVINLVGLVAPALAGVVALPLLAHRLGADRLGVLSIGWVVIGYFSLFDIGIGRALTQAVAASLGAREIDRVPALVWTALAVLLAIGLAGGIAVALSAPWLTASVLHVPRGLTGETEMSLYLLAAAVPAMMVSAGGRGVLEAYQAFGLVNLVRVPTGILMYAGPALTLPFTHSVVWAIAVVAFVRIAGAGGFVALCFRRVPGLWASIQVGRQAMRQLLGSGVWMMIANVIGSLVLYLDRLVVGALLPIAAVAYYATPQEVISKLSVIPMAFGAVMFPAFSTEVASRGPRLTALFNKSLGYTFLALFPITFGLAAFAPELLRLWLGAEFAANSAQVAEWFALGVLANGLAATPFALLQGAGQAHVTAVLQAIELAVYVPALWFATAHWGLPGAACTWAARMAADTLMLLLCSRRVLSAIPITAAGWAVGSAAVAAFAATILLPQLTARVVVFSIVSAAVLLVAARSVDRTDIAVLMPLRARGTGRNL